MRYPIIVAALAMSAPALAENIASPITSQEEGLTVRPRNAGEMPVILESFAPVTILPRAQIERDGAATLGEALATQPGLSSSGYAPGAASRPIIRGLDNQRVRIQENGIGTHDVSELGEDHASPINPLINDRIDVIRGPATLRYGTQAIGGVVNVQNNRIPTQPRDGVSGRIIGNGSSVDQGREAAFSVDAGHKNVAVHADAFASASDSYQTPKGQQLNSQRQAQGGAVGASWFFDAGYLGFSLSHYNSSYNIPGGASATNRTALFPTEDRLQLQGEYRLGASMIDVMRLWAGASRYQHQEKSLDAGAYVVGSEYRNRQVEWRIEAEHQPITTSFGTLNGAIGWQTDLRALRTAGEAGSLLPPTDSFNTGVFLFEELKLSQGYRLQAAARLDSAQHEGTQTRFPAGFLPNGNPLDENAVTRRYLPKSLSIGLLKDLPFDLVGRLNAQSVERAPTGAELFSRGAHDATSTFEIGQANLKLERAQTIELGVRRGFGQLRLDASLFHTSYSGFIYKHLTGTLCGDAFSTCGVDTELKQVVYQQQDARFRGAELSAQLDVVELGRGMFGLDAQYDRVAATFSDGSRAPRIPPQRIGAGLFWREPQGWSARIFLLHAFSQTKIAAEETATKGYNLLSADLSYSHRLKGSGGLQEMTIGIKGTNLLNDDVRYHTSFKKDEVLAPGRGVRVFSVLRF